jgi:type VI secretion system protein ImpC
MNMQIPASPFKILALAPVLPQHKTCWEQDPIQVDKYNLDEVMHTLSPSVHIPLPRDLCPAGGLDLSLTGLKSLHPDGLVETNPFFNHFLEAKEYLKEAFSRGLSHEQIAEGLGDWPDLPPIQIPSANKAPSKKAASAVENILKIVALPEQDTAAISASLPKRVGQVDAIMRQVLGRVFSAPSFRDIEAVWRGVKLLLDQGKTDGNVRLEIVPVVPETLDETLTLLAPRLIQTPPSIVILDLAWDNSPKSIESLHRVAELGEIVLAPVICWITNQFFYLDSWHTLNTLPYLPHHLDGQPYAKWRRLAGSPSAKWLAVTCNRLVARYPYGQDNPARTIPFEESAPLFVSPVWALAALIAQSVAATGWPTCFAQWQRIRITDLALYAPGTKDAIATETSFSEDRIEQFIKAGILPLVSPRRSDIAFSPGDTTVAGVPLSYQVLVSKVSHFVLWCKDNFAASLEPDDLKKRLEKAFALLWETTGHPAPKGLDITLGKLDKHGKQPVTITLTPSREVLPSGATIELQFLW